MEKTKKVSGSIWQKIIFAISLFYVFFHIYTAAFGVVSGVGQKALHIGIVMVIYYLREFVKIDRKMPARLWDILCCVGVIASIAYLIRIDATYALRAGITYTSDIIFGIILIVTLLDCTRRIVGNSLCIVISAFILYAFVGQYLPSFLKYSGMSLKRFINVMYLGTDGILAPLSIRLRPLLFCSLFWVRLCRKPALAHSLPIWQLSGSENTVVARQK